jgi:hypothetical protein
MLETICALLIATTTLTIQSISPSEWVGVWQGELDGQPGVVLTLAQDNGALEGTLVLNIITRDGGQPHIMAREPHTLIQPHLDGARLSFHVRRPDGSAEPAGFSVEFTSHNHAKIHCLNCGGDAPFVEMAKAGLTPLSRPRSASVTRLTGPDHRQTAMLCL